jgi:hypothetical protein
MGVIEEKGKNSFITNLPSSDILNHMVNLGPMDMKTVKGKIRFEKGVENDVYKYEIEKVWVQFKGLTEGVERISHHLGNWLNPWCTKGCGHKIHKKIWAIKTESSCAEP